MQKDIWTKGLVIGIILIFVGASYGTAENTTEKIQNYFTTAENENSNGITSLDTIKENITDDNILSSLGSGNFWIDLNSSNGHNGGKFENEASLWTITKQILDDDFDDTGYQINWTTEPGIYSEIRTDEDLWDNTTSKGACCAAAAEQGGILWVEDSVGYTNICTLKGFSVNQYVNASLPNFEITNAKLYCDYKMYSWDFDSINNYVYFNIIIKDDENSTWNFFQFKEHSGNSDAPNNIGHGYPGDGYCTDFWDPGNGQVNPNESINDYNVNRLSNNQTLAAYLNAKPYNTNFSIYFWLDIRLYGRPGNVELFKFWLDDFGIYCEYTYNYPPEKPTITGPISVKPNIAYKWNFTSTDPDNDDVFYQINWGDGNTTDWLGPYHSGVSDPESHTYTIKGSYTIKCIAKDINGAESDWGTLAITVPCSYKLPIILLLDKFFQSFPDAFPILRHLLGY
jgi:hypothetical protein